MKTVYRLYEENNHNLLTDRLTFIYLELDKFTKGLEELDDSVLDGMYFCLKNMSKLTECPDALNHGVFRKMFQISELRNMDEETRSKVIEKMTTERDLRNQMAYAKKMAIAEGLEKGLVEGRAETIRKLLESGMSLAVIAEALNLSAEETEFFK